MIESLSYVGFSSPRASEWVDLWPEVLGLQLAPSQPDGLVRLRMDDAAYRISIGEGEIDKLDHVGWAVAGSPVTRVNQVKDQPDELVSLLTSM